MNLTELLASFVALGGVAAFVTVVVAALKQFGVIQDGQSGNVSLVLNLVLFVLFVVAKVVNFDVTVVDSALSGIASVLTALLALLGQIIASKGLYLGAKATNIPVVGFTFSK